jgi:hypothetical protein
MRVIVAGWGVDSNVTMHINGSLGRVIDTKLFRTHLSRDGADCRRIIWAGKVYTAAE